MWRWEAVACEMIGFESMRSGKRLGMSGDAMRCEERLDMEMEADVAGEATLPEDTGCDELQRRLRTLLFRKTWREKMHARQLEGIQHLVQLIAAEQARLVEL